MPATILSKGCNHEMRLCASYSLKLSLETSYLQLFPITNLSPSTPIVASQFLAIICSHHLHPPHANKNSNKELWVGRDYASFQLFRIFQTLISTFYNAKLMPCMLIAASQFWGIIWCGYLHPSHANNNSQKGWWPCKDINSAFFLYLKVFCNYDYDWFFKCNKFLAPL